MQIENIESIIQRITNPVQTTMDFKYQSNKKNTKTKIAAYDINGYLIKTYNKIAECAADGFHTKSVSKCLTGKLKTHNNFIFIKYENQEPNLKIDTREYKARKNSLKFNSLQILKTITENKVNNTKQKIHIPKGNRTRIGMFEKNGNLIKIFLSSKELEEYDYKARYAVYQQIYGECSEKLKKGYKGKYFFRRLEAGKTYTLEEKYDYNQIPFDCQKRFFSRNINTIPIEEPKAIPLENTVIPIEELKTIPIEDIIIPTEEPKRNFMQRLRYLFTGK